MFVKTYFFFLILLNYYLLLAQGSKDTIDSSYVYELPFDSSKKVFCSLDLLEDNSAFGLEILCGQEISIDHLGDMIDG